MRHSIVVPEVKKSVYFTLCSVDKELSVENSTFLKGPYSTGGAEGKKELSEFDGGGVHLLII